MSNPLPTIGWNVLFFGMPCAFSAPILSALDRPDVNLAAVISPMRGSGDEPFRKMHGVQTRGAIPLASRGANFHAPRYLVRDLNHPRLTESLAHLKPDLIVVACFPRLIPPCITTLARISAVNVHPSVLPRHRGPDPLFWTFRAGDEVAGVTIHALSGDFDTGDILDQSEVLIAPRESLAELEQRLARIGANQVTRIISALPDLPMPTPQDPARATAETYPQDRDRVVDPEWTVARARNFIAGVAPSHGPLTYVDPAGKVVRITGLAAADDGQIIAWEDGNLRVSTQPQRL